MPLPMVPSSSLNPMSFTENQHGNQVLERLRLQRESGRFCDVVLVVQGRHFPAHRNILAAGSPYFDSILKMNKVVKEQVTVNCLIAEIFELLLSYMYSGSVVIDRNNVMELLKLSNNFLVTKLKNYCAEYLDRYLDPGNCLKVKDLAQKYNMPGLVKNACLFLEANINRVLLESLDILDWPLPKVETLYSDPNYEIQSDTWLRFIIRWVAAHPVERESSFKQLLSFISLAQIDGPTLTRMVDTDPLFEKSEPCRFAILQAMYESSIPLHKYESQYQALLAKHSGEVNVYFNTAIPPVPGAPGGELENPNSAENTIALSNNSQLQQNGNLTEGSLSAAESSSNIFERIKANVATSGSHSESKSSSTNNGRESSTGSLASTTEGPPPPIRLTINLPPAPTQTTVAPLAILVNGPTTSREEHNRVRISTTAVDPSVNYAGAVPIVHTRDNQDTNTIYSNEPNQPAPYIPSTRIYIKQEVPDEVVEPGRDSGTYIIPSYPSSSSAAGNMSTNVNNDNNSLPPANDPPTENSVAIVAPLKLKLKLTPAALLTRKAKLLGKHKLIRKYGGLNNMGVKRRGRPPKPKFRLLTENDDEYNQPVRIMDNGEAAGGADGEGAKAEVVFRCPHCMYTSTCQSRIQAHIEKAHSRNRSFVCNLCNFQCRWNREYYMHMKQHFQGPPFKCDTCDYSAERIQMLLTHRMKHTDERPYRCTQCDYRCRTKTNLVAHMRSHTGEKPFSCPECGRGFAIKSTLDQHLATHSDIRPFRCDQCSFSTKYQSHLISHKRIHTGDVFHCQFADCSYSSPKKSQLAAHLRTHLAVRAHTCKLCSRSFIEKSHLVRHERIHLTEKPFKCEHCEYASSRRDKLKEHIQKHHGSQPAGRGPYKRRYRRAKQGLKSRSTGSEPIGGPNSSSHSEAGTSETSDTGLMGSGAGFRPITPMSASSVPQTGQPLDINTLLSPSPLLSRPSSAIFPSYSAVGSHNMQPSPALSLNFNLDLGHSYPSPAVNKDVLLSTQVAPTPTPGNVLGGCGSPHSTAASLQSEPFPPASGTPTADLLQRPMSLPPLGGQTNSNWSQLSDFSFTAMF